MEALTSLEYVYREGLVWDLYTRGAGMGSIYRWLQAWGLKTELSWGLCKEVW